MELRQYWLYLRGSCSDDKGGGIHKRWFRWDSVMGQWGKAPKDLSCHTIYGNTRSSFDLLTGVCVVVQQRAKAVKAKSEQKEDNEDMIFFRLYVWHKCNWLHARLNSSHFETSPCHVNPVSQICCGKQRGGKYSKTPETAKRLGFCFCRWGQKQAPFFPSKDC